MILRNAKIEDLSEIYGIECANFTPSEVISLKVFEEYIQKTPETFFVIEEKERVVAYCLSVLSSSETVTDDLFNGFNKMTSDNGYLKILSLSIHYKFQKQGFGTMLLATLKDYCQFKSYYGISLTCHDVLIPYYQMNGFKEIGLSDSTFGNQIWYDMILEESIY